MLIPPQGATATPPPDDKGLRLIGRISIGFFAGAFAAPAVWVAIVSWTGQWGVAEFVVVPAWILCGLVAGCMAYSRLTPIRVAVWALAGLGMGLFLDAILAGGLGVGDWLTPSGIVLGLLLGGLGYRRGRTLQHQTRPETRIEIS